MNNRFDLVKKGLRLIGSKNAWQNVKWKFNGRFYIPELKREQKGEEVVRRLMDETVGVAVVHQEVFGEQMPIDSLLKLMSTISYSSWILLLSRIAAVLSSRGKYNMETQIQLAQMIFNEKILAKIDSISSGGNKIIFTEWQIANLAKIALLKCKQLPMAPHEILDNKETIGLCLLGINDYFGRRTILDSLNTEADTETKPFLESLIRNYCYQNGEYPKHLLARFYDLYFKLCM
jgi:hypothetical protein